MNYVKHILLPGEQVLYDGHVHPKVLTPGVLWLAFAALIMVESSHTGGGRSFLLNFAYHITGYWPGALGFYKMLAKWQSMAPASALEIKIFALIVALYGFSKMMSGLVLMQSTELIVTDQRVIAKAGIMTITTVEMDRRRVAGVTIDQSFMGRILGYGHISIQGFTSSIGGLPIMVNPYLVQQFLNVR
jgi:uncharacterized membrane protein YdbT with pleckstrin-like domain